MGNAVSTFLQITNNTITESGASLATFAADGSDFSTNTTALMQKMKGWVSRGWKDIQQDAYDWEFMEEQGLCNVDPGIMFYTDGTPISAFAIGLKNTTFNIYDQDGTVAVPNVVSTTFTDLTGSATTTLPFGYFNINTAGGTQIQFALKPGAEYFTIATSATLTIGPLAVAGAPANGDAVSVTVISGNWTGIYPLCGTIINNTTAQFSFTNSAVIKALVDGTSLITIGSVNGTYQFVPGTAHTVVNSQVTGKAYVHSWKSFNFSEEIQAGDFQENIQEINQSTFRIIDYYKGPPSGEVPMEFIPWEVFQKSYDLSSAYPGMPRCITEDDTGRYRMYPAPYYTVSIKFDYDRQPQLLSAFGDIPAGLDEDFIDLLMWKALIYYGEYDEQPSVVMRATKNFKTMLQRLELRNREKFHFLPKRLY